MPSYSNVFSQPFILYTDSTPNTSFEVPTGFTAVVRQVIWCQIAGAGTLFVRMTGPGSGSPLNFITQAAIGLDDTYQWEGRVVVPAEYTLDFDLAAVGVSDNVYAGGYLLRNTLS